MISRERVEAVIEHQRPDRIPVYGWVKANMSEVISERFGSPEAFEDHYEFDTAHLFGGPGAYDGETMKQLRADCGGTITPADLLTIPMADPDVDSSYDGLRKDVQHHKTDRGRWVYVQTPGIFEAHNGCFGIENHLMHLALYPDDIKKVYQRQVDWVIKRINNCIDIGIDMIHISDDWGAQNALMFSPDMWRELIFPYHQQITRAVKDRGVKVSLHSDGNVNQVLDEIVELGYDVVHPWQESAGMSLEFFRDNYRKDFSVMGGLDVQSTIGFGKLDFLESEIQRVLGMFEDGGLIFCTTHFVQDHCTLEELCFAYDTVREIVGS